MLQSAAMNFCVHTQLFCPPSGRLHARRGSLSGVRCLRWGTCSQVVVSNAPSCGGMQFAATNGIPSLQYPGRKDDPHALSPQELVRALKEEHGVDIVCLAGYMKVSLGLTLSDLKSAPSSETCPAIMCSPSSGGLSMSLAVDDLVACHGIHIIT